MKFEIKLREDSRATEHQLSIERPSDGQDGREQAQFSIDGQAVEADWAEIRPGHYSILINGQSYEARVQPAPDSRPGQPDAWVVTIAEYDFHVGVRDPRTRRFAGQSVAHDGPLEVLAPMPGKIIRVLVGCDDQVAQDQGLVVIEAMKMQNELRAPRPGRITEVHVKEGIGIEAGAKLLRLE
ncbi:MAG TPA: biotin/lipoyl-containing protein [Terriglobia bacterium]|nr:biotin/lipoyl-containing protein [Terriglobia bacterium]